MSSQVIDPPSTGFTHPVAVFADRVNTRLDELANQPLHAMTPAEVRHSLSSLARGKAKYDAMELRLLGHAEVTGACLEAGAANAAAWVAAETHQTRQEARADLNLSKRLESLPVLEAGMTAGAVNSAQARAVVKSLDRLPTTGDFAVSREQLVKAEVHLVGLCATYDAREVEALGRHLFEVIAPEAAEAYEGKMLEVEEAKAARKTSLEMSVDDQGVAHGRFRIPRRHGEMLRKMIWSLTNPVRRGSAQHSPIDHDLPAAVRQGVALTQVIEALDAHWLPTHGGVGATVVVTMTLDQLLADLSATGVCSLDTGGTITAAEARRLACRAGIIPVVLGSKSVVLDAGQRTRFHTEPMRIALGLRDKTCTAEHCARRCRSCREGPGRSAWVRCGSGLWPASSTTDLPPRTTGMIPARQASLRA